MNVQTDDHFAHEESAGAYVLRALGDEETRAFEAHLESCERCRDDVARLRVAADALPASAPPVAPPPELKERIMSIVRSEAELLQAAGDRADVPAERAAEPRGFRWLKGSLRLRPAVALAAATFALILGGVVGFAVNGGGDSRTIVAQVDQTAAPNATAKLKVVDGSGTLQITGLRNPAAGRVYQVWLQRGGSDAPVPTNALFSTRSDGTASVSVPGDLDDVKQVMVTSEPAGGSSAPTEMPFISVSPA
jgi:anti-sigma-K factor RskA